MMPSENINALFPIFNWSWWQIFLTTFFICWVVGRIIKGLEPLGWERPLKKGGREIWWSGFYGDIFLPIGVTATVYSVRYLTETKAYYTSSWWNWLGFLIGYTIIIYLETRGNYTYKQLKTPSKLWHTFVAFPFMFYLTFVSVIPFFIVEKTPILITLALLGYGVWGYTLFHDIKNPPNYTKTH